ncbi:Mechanosensitive ion channel family protein [Euphorbia peplus]|nr:Mechanosensitive ion channel family protein [Euphorbia peplus]
MEGGKEIIRATNDVVLDIPSGQEAVLKKTQFRSSSPNHSNLELPALEDPSLRIQTSSSPILTPNSSKPPKIPSITTRKSLARSEFSKPKSRFTEPSYPNEATLKEEKSHLANSSSPGRVSVSTPRTTPVTPKTPLIGSPAPEEEEDEEVYKSASLKVNKKVGKKWKVSMLFELTVFICFIVLLVCSLTIDKLQDAFIWGLGLWKWCVLVLVIFCGRLVTQWFINILVFLIERNFLLRKKVLYFVYGLKKSVQAVIWLSLVLLAWGLLFNRGVKRTRDTAKVLNYITRGLAACVIGAVIWLVKTLLIKLLASSFHVTRFFDRIQEAVFHQYVLRALSGPPLMEMAENIGSSSQSMPGQLSFNTMGKKNEETKEEVIDVDKLKRMKHGKISAWTMKGLVNVVTGTGLSTLSNSLYQSDDEEGGQKDNEITSEWEAKAAAYKIFSNVAKPGYKYIDEDDLLRFMKKEEVDNVIPLFEGAAETGKIKRKVLKNWLVNVYNERKALAHSLNDTKTAIEELNKLASGIVLVLIMIVWLLMMGLLTTKIIVFISSQFLLVGFIFSNMAKTVFEAIIFVFVMHPFDVGDRCVIDGIQMIVEEMNILNTVFLRYDNEKIFYPNSVLATKPISNFYRSPEMSDSIEFSVDVSTSIETIGALKSRIKAYLESKPQHWRPGHSVQVKEIENVNKMKMALYTNHTINFQNAGDRGNRRSDLMLEMKNIFEDLGIKYHLLPQEVRVSNVNSAAPAVPSVNNVR